VEEEILLVSAIRLSISFWENWIKSQRANEQKHKIN